MSVGSHTSWRPVLAVALVALAGVTGCKLELPTPRPPEPYTACIDNDQCATGRACEAGYCVVRSRRVEPIALQVTPLADSELVSEQFVGVQLEQGSPLPDLVLKRPTLLTGQVEVFNATPTPIRARLRLNRVQPTIPGHNLSFSSTATATDGYFLRVPAGYYDITVLPDDRGLPPLSISGLPVVGDTEPPIRFEPAEAYSTVEGQVIFVDAANERQVPVADAQVRAFDSNQRAASTIGITDAEGRFSLTVRPEVSDYDLIVAPSESTPFLPRLVVSGLRIVGDNVNVGVQSLGRLLRRGRWIQGQVVGGDGRAVTSISLQGTQLIFQANLSDPDNPSIQSTFFTSALTDATGNFALALQPGAYTVRVTPPVASSFAAAEYAKLEVLAPGTVIDPETWRLRLKRKSVLAGQVLTPAGKALAGRTLVSVELLALSDNRIITVGTRTAQGATSVVTDDGGSFELDVDPGEYRVQAIPQDETGVARTPPRRVRVTSGEDAFVELCTSRPNVAYGRVLQPDARPLTDAKVEAFRTTSERGVWVLGSGRTDPDGIFRFLVPEICDNDELCEHDCQ